MLGLSGIKINNKNSIKNKMESPERIAKLEAQMDALKEDVQEVKHDIKEIHSRITTSNREIVDKIDDMQTRLEHKMQANAQISQDQHAEIKKEVVADLEKMNARVSALEQWKWYVIGGAAVLGFLLGHINEIAKYLK
jgi:small-conductance mechanosensitive channel